MAEAQVVPLSTYRDLYDAIKAVRDYRQGKPGTSLQSSYDLDEEMGRAAAVVPTLAPVETLRDTYDEWRSGR